MLTKKEVVVPMFILLGLLLLSIFSHDLSKIDILYLVVLAALLIKLIK